MERYLTRTQTRARTHTRTYTRKKNARTPQRLGDAIEDFAGTDARRGVCALEVPFDLPLQIAVEIKRL